MGGALAPRGGTDAFHTVHGVRANRLDPVEVGLARGQIGRHPGYAEARGQHRAWEAAECPPPARPALLSPRYADGARPPSQQRAADRDPRHRSAALHQWSYVTGSGHMTQTDHLTPLTRRTNVRGTRRHR